MNLEWLLIVNKKNKSYNIQKTDYMQINADIICSMMR